jgi:hypothetical protein
MVVSSTTGIVPNMFISGTGFVSDQYVVSVDIDGVTLVISAVADSTPSGTLTFTKGQGLNAVAIGKRAGREAQSANSIVINATGSNLNASVEGFHVAPVRNASTSDVVFYNSMTGEMTYSTLTGVSGFSGIDGAAGVSGFSGIDGAAGADGNDGVSGIDGAAGVSGFSGIDGAEGPEGPAGASGVSGFSGVWVNTVTILENLGPASSNQGRRAMITNGNLVATGNFGAAVTDGGANIVPIYSNGTDWLIG